MAIKDVKSHLKGLKINSSVTITQTVAFTDHIIKSTNRAIYKTKATLRNYLFFISFIILIIVTQLLSE